MKLSEFITRIDKLREGVAAAIKEEIIDTNIDYFGIMFCDSDGNERNIDDIQLDIMGEPHRIMLIEKEED